MALSGLKKQITKLTGSLSQLNPAIVCLLMLVLFVLVLFRYDSTFTNHAEKFASYASNDVVENTYDTSMPKPSASLNSDLLPKGNNA